MLDRLSNVALYKNNKTLAIVEVSAGVTNEYLDGIYNSSKCFMIH